MLIVVRACMIRTDSPKKYSSVARDMLRRIQSVESILPVAHAMASDVSHTYAHVAAPPTHNAGGSST